MTDEKKSTLSLNPETNVMYGEYTASEIQLVVNSVYASVIYGLNAAHVKPGVFSQDFHNLLLVPVKEFIAGEMSKLYDKPVSPDTITQIQVLMGEYLSITITFVVVSMKSTTVIPGFGIESFSISQPRTLTMHHFPEQLKLPEPSTACDHTWSEECAPDWRSHCTKCGLKAQGSGQ